jgi:hypothetical protein
MKELLTMKLNWKYPGGPLKFFQQFQNCYLDLESATKKAVPDAEKIGALNAALEDPRFQTTVRTTVETLALQTGTAIDYPSYLLSLITHAESLKTSNRQTNSAQTQRQQHTGHKKDDWKRDMLAYVPFKEFQKLSAEEKAKHRKAKEEAKKTQTSRSSNASEVQPTVQVPTVVHVDAAQSTPVPSGAATVVSEAMPWTQQQPSIRDIFFFYIFPDEVSAW